jgi:tetratricopeptide (TPR) repeat protein
MEAAAPAALDYEKDFSAIVKKFEGVIESDPSSTAALMAALNIAEIGAQYHKEDVALSALNKAKPSTNILSVLLLNEKATAQANLNDCKSAVETWSKLVNLPQAAAIKGQVLLKQGLCYESLNDNVKAEENYNKVIADSKEGNLSKSAEKYIRLLKSK